MPHYEVTTGIGIDADTPKEAAEEFARQMLGWTSDGYHLTVRDADDNGDPESFEAVYDRAAGDVLPTMMEIKNQ